MFFKVVCDFVHIGYSCQIVLVFSFMHFTVKAPRAKEGAIMFLKVELFFVESQGFPDNVALTDILRSFL
jgi:hypothetical protein